MDLRRSVIPTRHDLFLAFTPKLEDLCLCDRFTRHAYCVSLHRQRNVLLLQGVSSILLALCLVLQILSIATAEACVGYSPFPPIWTTVVIPLSFSHP